MRTEKLLREYVRAVLTEDEGGGGGDGGVYGDLSMADATGSPYGMSFGSGKDLYNIFVKPFTDVVGVAAGKTKELSEKGQTLLKVAFESVATTLIPILKDSYSEIFKKEQDQIDKIRREYASVYQATWDAFKDNDVLVAAFMYAPAAFLTAGFAQKSPKVAMKLLSVLTGGSLDPWLKKVKAKFYGPDKKDLGMGDKLGGHKSGANKAIAGGAFGPMESKLREEDEEKKPSIGKVLGSDKVRAKLAESDLVKKMEQEGRAMVRGTLTQVYKQASAVMAAKSLQDLQQKVGKPLKGVEQLKQVPQQERQGAEQQLLVGAKKGMAEFYAQNLEGQAKKAVEAGVPESHPYVQDIQKVISKIKAL
jgi:hypothetical protein